MTPYLPITPQQIADQAVEAAAAGAAILHLHARIPETGAPPQDPKLYEQFVPEIRDQCEAILNITTGGGLGMPLGERLAAARWAEPELASMNLGSVNFNISSAAARISEFKNDWEKNVSGRDQGFHLVQHLRPNRICDARVDRNRDTVRV